MPPYSTSFTSRGEDEGGWGTNPDFGRSRSGPRDQQFQNNEVRPRPYTRSGQGEEEATRGQNPFTYDLWRKERYEREMCNSLLASRIRPGPEGTQETRIRSQDTKDQQSLADIPAFVSEQDVPNNQLPHLERDSAPSGGSKDGESSQKKTHDKNHDKNHEEAYEEAHEEAHKEAHEESHEKSHEKNHEQQTSNPPEAVVSNPPPSTRAAIATGCRCPIDLECEARDDHLLDCRTLVMEWKQWKEKHARENISVPPIDVPPEQEPFATAAEVSSIIELLDDVQQQQRMSVPLRDTFGKIEEWIRRMKSNSVTEAILAACPVVEHLSKFLSFGNRLVLRQKEMPQHMIEDLTIIQRKWSSGDLSVLARRGLRLGRGGQYSVDPAWRLARTDNYLGHGYLVNGQTWHYRAEMNRDGAHGPNVGGIAGTAKEGARSIVMGSHDAAKNEYADVDNGNEIWYMGTALPRQEGDNEATNLKDEPDNRRRQRVTRNSKGQGPTVPTQALITSYRTRNPVRVFRSFRLAETVPMRPPRGFRYDGLYEVVDFELCKIERQIYRFKLVRLQTGQGPLRESLPPPAPERRERKRKREA
ncbi:hypothetical protein ABEF93_007696 [Exophiala dermatitidis]